MLGHYVKVKLVCDRCREVLDLCQPVHREVPPPVACNPGGPSNIGGGGGGGGGSFSCPVCGCNWNMTLTDLNERIEDETRHGWGQIIRDGAVVIHCPAA